MQRSTRFSFFPISPWLSKIFTLPTLEGEPHFAISTRLYIHHFPGVLHPLSVRFLPSPRAQSSEVGPGWMLDL